MAQGQQATVIGLPVAAQAVTAKGVDNFNNHEALGTAHPAVAANSVGVASKPVDAPSQPVMLAQAVTVQA